MKLRSISSIFCLILLGFALIQLPLNEAEARKNSVTDELLVKFKSGVPLMAQESLLHSYGANIKTEIAQIHVKVISVASHASEYVRGALSRSSMVEYIEENMVFTPTVIPNDPYYPDQWHLNKIAAMQAWDVSKGSQSGIIAVCDSGVNTNHPDLSSKILTGYNFYDNNNDVSDVYGHGTKVAGTVAASTDNLLGVASVGWVPMILPVRVTDTSGYAYSSTLSQCLTYAADHGAITAVMSFGIYGGSVLTDAAKYLYDKGGLAVAAGGNDGNYHSDSDNPYIISVSATDQNDNRASWSSYGPYIDLSAPGVGIVTTERSGGYTSVSGTSFSAPIVAGLVSLIFGVNQNLMPNQVLDVLKQSSKDLGSTGYDNYYGWGRVDAYQAVLKASQTSSETDTSPPTVSISSPQSGAQVTKAISIAVNADDNNGVTKVELYKNNILLAVDTYSPYSFTWDTTADPNGSYSLVAKAFDDSNNVGTSNVVTVTTNNIADTTPPTVSIISPTQGTTLKGSITISVKASDTSGIQRIEFYIDGSLKTTDYKTPYTYKWNTKSVKDGTCNILVKVYDNAGNSEDSSISVTVRNRR